MSGLLKLSDRIGPQSGLAVTDVEASMGVGTDGNPSNHAVCVEDMASVRATVTNNGPDPVTVCKLQVNEFTPTETDPRWVDIPVVFNVPIASGATERAIAQIEGYRWMRLRAACAAGTTAAIDLAWTGSQG